MCYPRCLTRQVSNIKSQEERDRHTIANEGIAYIEELSRALKPVAIKEKVVEWSVSPEALKGTALSTILEDEEALAVKTDLPSLYQELLVSWPAVMESCKGLYRASFIANAFMFNCLT
eukprot:TRINITY_DN37883_c0_g1_i1.p1 TRINITY_DN37883_c0_g1~~TRINITY_DN37883_c0_g1_i1.p1  ORF type:complete len:118 (-),score=7.94 TRINITY_DN37883_c0_g1_i1:179-532(-)